MRSVTCVVHGGEVDDVNTVALPHGPVCEACYEWMETLMDEDDDDEDYDIIIEFEFEDDDE